MASRPPNRPEPGAPRPSDAEIRAIAEQLAREVREPPGASPTGQLLAQAGGVYLVQGLGLPR